MKNKALWVWYLNKLQIEKFIQYVKDNNYTKIMLNWESIDKNYPVIKNELGIDVSILIGDQNKLTAKEIISRLESVNHLSEIKQIHLDLELPSIKEINSYLNTLYEVVTYFKDKDYKVEIAVETWNLHPTYKSILNKADEWYLMNYSKHWFTTILKGFGWYSKPFYMGVETIPEMNKICLREQEYSILDKVSNLLFKNYKGLAIHHYGSVR